VRHHADPLVVLTDHVQRGVELLGVLVEVGDEAGQLALAQAAPVAAQVHGIQVEADGVGEVRQVRVEEVVAPAVDVEQRPLVAGAALASHQGPHQRRSIVLRLTRSRHRQRQWELQGLEAVEDQVGLPRGHDRTLLQEVCASDGAARAVVVLALEVVRVGSGRVRVAALQLLVDVAVRRSGALELPFQ